MLLAVVEDAGELADGLLHFGVFGEELVLWGAVRALALVVFEEFDFEDVGLFADTLRNRTITHILHPKHTVKMPPEPLQKPLQIPNL